MSKDINSSIGLDKLCRGKYPVYEISKHYTFLKCFFCKTDKKLYFIKIEDKNIIICHECIEKTMTSNDK